MQVGCHLLVGDTALRSSPISEQKARTLLQNLHPGHDGTL